MHGSGRRKVPDLGLTRRPAVHRIQLKIFQQVGNPPDPVVTILSTNSFAYDDDGNRTNSVTWRRVGTNWVGATNTYILDAQNRVIQTIDPLGFTNAVLFNALGQQAQS